MEGFIPHCMSVRVINSLMSLHVPIKYAAGKCFMPKSLIAKLHDTTKLHTPKGIHSTTTVTVSVHRLASRNDSLT